MVQLLYTATTRLGTLKMFMLASFSHIRLGGVKNYVREKQYGIPVDKFARNVPHMENRAAIVLDSRFFRWLNRRWSKSEIVRNPGLYISYFIFHITERALYRK